MKKLLGLILAITVLATLFSACSQTATDQSSAPPADSSKTTAAPEQNSAVPVEFDVWMQTDTLVDANDQKIPDLIIAETFMERNPNVKMNLIPNGGADVHQKKVTMAASSNSLPEVYAFTCANNTGIPQLGVLYDITDYIDNDPEWADAYIPEAWKMHFSVTDGRKYGIPTSTEAQGFFYNKRLFDEQGLEIPTTWEDFTHCVEVLKNAGIVPIAHGATDVWSRWGYDLFFSRYGLHDKLDALKDGSAKFSDFAVNPFERIQELAKLGAYNENVATANYSQALELFKSGKAAIITTGSWELDAMTTCPESENLVFNWGPSFPDGIANQNYSTKTTSWTLWITNKANSSPEKLDAVVRFLKFYSSPEMTDMSVETRNKLTATKYTGTKGDELPKLYKDMLKNLADDSIGVGEMGSYFDPSLEAVMWNAITSSITLSITPEEAALQLDDAMALVLE